jgi:DNA polymerase-3 subunit alpha
VESAKKLGWKKLALTDINNSTAIPEFIKSCKKHSIKAAAGIEFRLKNKLLYIGLAKNNNGLNELNKFLSYHNLNKINLPEKAPNLKDVYFIYPFISEESILLNLGENEFLAINAMKLSKMPKIPIEKHPKLLAWQPFSFTDMKSFEVHKHLRAIDNNTLISKLKDDDIAEYWHRPISPQRMGKAFYNYPFLLQNSEKLMQSCSIEMDFKKVKNKKHFTSHADEDRDLLRKLTFNGLKERYGLKNTKAVERVEKELKIINDLGFSAYFLITWDMIRYALSRGFYHVGRGSGANSVVAYCLKIVDVDPIELDLYFERFINPHRTSPPDFDIDFSWKNRNEIQKYLFDKYGKEHTALLGTISTFKGKSIYRELAKVYGLPKEEIDDFIKYPNAARHRSEICMKIHKIAANMSGMPNLRSIHAGGVLISEEPITNYTALDMPPKGFPTTQWDMYVAEDLGFEKIDVLSQRGIGHIIETVEIIKENKNLDINIHDIQKFKEDEKIKSLLKSAETLGCFYIESPAMRGLITKLKCDNYLNLVAASSIIRPGVAKSGMMKEYIKRHHNPHGFKYLHPVMETQLKETYGIMVYQEDVLKVCHHFAGLDLGDSDILRRAMSGKTRSKEEFDRIVEKFHKNCIEKKYPKNIVDEVWRQIESFAGYSFSKAHSASYAVESYQSLFLKAYFPIEFITAVINNFGGFYQSWVYFNEAKRLGAKIILPCVNNSNYLSSTDGENIFMGFIHINNFERKIAFRIEEERKQNGEFTSLSDFVMRILPEIQQLLILIRSGAFNFTKMSKAKLMWTAYSLVNKKSKSNKSRLLFEPQIKKYKLPELENNSITDAYDEIELLGFTISTNYFDLLQTNFRQEIETLKMKFYSGCKVRMLGNLVTIKYVKTKKGDYMHFATFVDHKGNLFDSVHFANSVKTYPFKGSGIYLVYGEIVEEYGHFMIDVYKMAKMPLKENPVL